MRFSNLVAILALGVVSADVSVEDARNLRGSEEDRELISIGAYGSAAAYSKSNSFSFHKCWKADACVDIEAHCKAAAYADTYTGTSGNAKADAEFHMYALCKALATAHGRSCACVKAHGDIKLDADQDGWNGMTYKLYIALKTATLTFAQTYTSAEAHALTAGGGYVYATTDDAYCSGPGKGSYYCDPSKAKAYASASALGYGGAEALSGAVAASGSGSFQKGYLVAKGQDVSSIGALFTSVAKSFSFSAAGSSAMASAYTAVAASAVAIAEHCDKAYDTHCSYGKCSFKDKKEACDSAIAYGKTKGVSYASSAASAVAAAFAKVYIAVIYGGTLKNLANNGKKLSLEWADGKSYVEANGAMVCPRYY